MYLLFRLNTLIRENLLKFHYLLIILDLKLSVSFLLLYSVKCRPTNLHKLMFSDSLVFQKTNFVNCSDTKHSCS